MTRFLLENSEETFSPNVIGLLPTDTILFSLDGVAYSNLLPTFGNAQLGTEREVAIPVYYVIQRDGMTFNGLVSVDLVRIDEYLKLEATYPYGSTIPYSHNVELVRPTLAYSYWDAQSASWHKQGEFTDEMWDYYVASVNYQVIQIVNTTNFWLDELSKDLTGGQSAFIDPTIATTDTYTAKLAGNILLKQAGIDVFSNADSNLVEDHMFLGWILKSGAVETIIVKGEAQPWTLTESEGTKLVNVSIGEQTDLSDLIAFEDSEAQLSDYTVRYTVTDSTGSVILTDVTADAMMLAPGEYTVEISLTSGLFETTTGAESYALVVLDERDFFEFALRDETRGQTLDVDGAEAFYNYRYDAANHIFRVSAWYAPDMPGAYTFYGLNLTDKSNGAMRSMLFSLTGEAGTFVPLEQLAFSADKPGEYTLFYRLEGTHDALPVWDEGDLHIVIETIDLGSVFTGLQLNKGEYDHYIHRAYDGHARNLSEVLTAQIVPIAEWGGYLPSLADLTVTLYGEEYINGRYYEREYTGSVDAQIGFLLDVDRTLVVWDAYHTTVVFDQGEDYANDYNYEIVPYYGKEYGPQYTMDQDWREAYIDPWSDAGQYINGGADDMDDALIITPYLLDGYDDDFYNLHTGSAFEEIGLVRLDWELMVEFYDYGDLNLGKIQSLESRSLSGSMQVNDRTLAEDLRLIVQDMNRAGAYVIGVYYAGYNDEGTELFTMTNYATIRTPTHIDIRAEGEEEVYYDGDEHGITLGGLKENDIITLEYQELDVQTGEATGQTTTLTYYVMGFDPDTGEALGALYDPDDIYWWPDPDLPTTPVSPKFIGDALFDNLYQVSYTIYRPTIEMGEVGPRALAARAGAFQQYEEDYTQNLINLPPIYTPYQGKTNLTIKATAKLDIKGVTAEGFEGLEDGGKHGITIHGLRVSDENELEDTLVLTVYDESGNPVSGLENVSLADIAGWTLQPDGSVYIPLLTTTGGQTYQVSYTVSRTVLVEDTYTRSLVFRPLTQTATLTLLSSDTVLGVDKTFTYDAMPHSIGLENLKGDGAGMGDAVVLNWWTSVDPTKTQTQPTFTAEGVYTIYFEAQREITGAQGTYLETYLGSAVLEILPFAATASGWTGVYDGASHGVTLEAVDWQRDTVQYAVGSGGFTTATSAAELPSFVNAGQYKLVVRVTQGAATLEMPVEVNILPMQITGVVAEDVRAYADGSEYSISVSGNPQGTQIYYIVNGVETTQKPVYSAVGSYSVPFVIRGENYADFSGTAMVNLLKIDGHVAEGYKGVWDGNMHSITIHGAGKDDVIYYRVGLNGAETLVNPGFTDIGLYEVYYRLERYLDGKLAYTRSGMQTVNILPIDSPQIVVSGYNGVYDGGYHTGVTFTGNMDDVTAYYYDNVNGSWLSEAPSYRDAGSYPLTVKLVNAMGDAISIQHVNVTIRQRALQWDLSNLKLDGITKVADGSNRITGVEGALGISGVLPGDNVHFTYDDFLAYLISNEMGDNVPAAIRFNGVRIDNANYALPQDALFTFRVRHLEDSPAIPDGTVMGAQENEDAKGGTGCRLVTDERWKPKPYEWREARLTISEAEGAERLLVIEALPVLDEDGEPILREDGTPLYELRNLHLSARLLARLERAGYAYVLFRLGDAVLLIPLAELETGADYIFTLEPVVAGEETDWELKALEQLDPHEEAHRVCVRKNGEKIALREVSLWLGTAQEAAQEFGIACADMEEAERVSAASFLVESAGRAGEAEDCLCTIHVAPMPACGREDVTYAALP